MTIIIIDIVLLQKISEWCVQTSYHTGISHCSIMEVIVVHSKEHLNLTSLEGYAPLHYAALYGNTQVCSLLAAQVDISSWEFFIQIKIHFLHISGFGKHQHSITQSKVHSSAHGHREVTLECSGVPRWVGSSSQFSRSKWKHTIAQNYQVEEY